MSTTRSNTSPTTTSTTRSNTTNQHHQRQQTTQVTILHVNHNSITITRSASNRSVVSVTVSWLSMQSCQWFTPLDRLYKSSPQTEEGDDGDNETATPRVCGDATPWWDQPAKSHWPPVINSSTCTGRLMLLTTTLQYLCTDCNLIINFSACPRRLMLLTRNTTLRAQALCESRGGRPGLPSLINLDVKQHFNTTRHYFCTDCNGPLGLLSLPALGTCWYWLTVYYDTKT